MTSEDSKLIEMLIDNPYEKISTKESQLIDYQRRVRRIDFTKGHSRIELLHMINSSTGKKSSQFE